MSDNTTIPQTFTNSELPVDTVYFMSADKDGKLQFPGKIDATSINISLDNIDSSGLKFSNLNINAFQEKGWNSGNFPTNATYTPWPSTISAKGWFLGKVQKTNSYSSTNREYYIWLTGIQQKSEIVYGGTIDSSLLVTPENISENHILTIYTGQSYINKFLVTGVGTGDDGKAITIKIIDLYNTVDPFTTFNFSPYFKGVVLITGKASDNEFNKDKNDNDIPNLSWAGLIGTDAYNPINYITSKYIRNGIVELGYCNLSVGDSNSIGGFMNSAFGPDNITFDGYSTALGNQNTIMGYASSAIGQNNKIYGEKSIAAGAHNKVAAQFSLISGHNNTVKHSSLTVNNEKSYSGFFVSGGYNTLDISDANNNLSYPSNALLGYKLISNYPGQIILGRYNKNDRSNLLEIGIGTSLRNRQNAFEITQNGTIRVPVFNKTTNELIKDEYVELKVYKVGDSSYKLAINNNPIN
jgi:hypothetical protein